MISAAGLLSWVVCLQVSELVDGAQELQTYLAQVHDAETAPEYIEVSDYHSSFKHTRSALLSRWCIDF